MNSVKYTLFFWFWVCDEGNFIQHWENSFFDSKKHFFDIRSKNKFLWIKESFVNSKKLLSSKEIDLFTLKKIFLNQQNFFQFKDIFSLTVYQRTVSLIHRNCFLGAGFTLRKKIWLNQRQLFVWKTVFDLKKWFISIKESFSNNLLSSIQSNFFSECKTCTLENSFIESKKIFVDTQPKNKFLWINESFVN